MILPSLLCLCVCMDGFSTVGNVMSTFVVVVVCVTNIQYLAPSYSITVIVAVVVDVCGCWPHVRRSGRQDMMDGVLRPPFFRISSKVIFGGTKILGRSLRQRCFAVMYAAAAMTTIDDI